MPVSKSLVVVVVCAGGLAGCGGNHHKPIDTSNVFKVESTLGSDFKTKTKGPTDINPKMLGPEKLPEGVTFDPEDCRDYISGGRLPKGTRGRMSVLSAEGDGNRLSVIAVQADNDVPFDAEAAKRCAHVTFEAGKVTGYIDEVDAPHIDGVTTLGTHRQIAITVNDSQHSSEVYTFTAYMGDAMVLVTASPVRVKGQPAPPIDADRARQLLTDSVTAVRG